MISPAVLLLNSKTFSIISFSCGSIEPFSPPMSTIIRISSSETRPCPCVGVTPKSSRMRLVTKLSRVTKGAVAEAMKLRGRATNRDSGSLYCIAMRLGTSSPRISVRNARTIVTAMVAMPSTVLSVSGHHVRAANQRARGCANVTAAKAEARKPASVTPTWIVARKRPGSSMNLPGRLAPRRRPGRRRAGPSRR